MKGPKCKSENVWVQLLSETELKRKHHGLLYWLLIGWWLQPLLWIFFTLPMLIITIFRPGKYQTRTVHKKRCAFVRSVENRGGLSPLCIRKGTEFFRPFSLYPAVLGDTFLQSRSAASL